jgi:hypothetical protein
VVTDQLVGEYRLEVACLVEVDLIMEVVDLAEEDFLMAVADTAEVDLPIEAAVEATHQDDMAAGPGHHEGHPEDTEDHHPDHHQVPWDYLIQTQTTNGSPINQISRFTRTTRSSRIGHRGSARSRTYFARMDWRRS